MDIYKWSLRLLPLLFRYRYICLLFLNQKQDQIALEKPARLTRQYDMLLKLTKGKTGQKSKWQNGILLIWCGLVWSGLHHLVSEFIGFNESNELYKAFMPIYNWSRFLARVDGWRWRDRSRVVHEVLADLKTCHRSSGIWDFSEERWSPTGIFHLLYSDTPHLVSTCIMQMTDSDTQHLVIPSSGTNHLLYLGVSDTLSDSIQCLNFFQKMIHSIFNSISLYPRLNLKYHSIQKKFCWFNSKDNSIQ